jgi:hypothetical protein
MAGPEVSSGGILMSSMISAQAAGDRCLLDGARPDGGEDRGGVASEASRFACLSGDRGLWRLFPGRIVTREHETK